MQLATAYVLAASNNDERLVDTRTVDFCKTKVIVSFKENREFNKRRFWATHVNRKWAFFSFNMPWRYQICIAKCFYFHRDDLTKHLFKITAQECKKSSSGWRASLKNVAEYSFSFWQLISRLVSDNTFVNVTSCIVWLPAQSAQLFNSLKK